MYPVGRGAESRTQTSGFRDRDAHPYVTPQYLQDAFKKCYQIIFIYIVAVCVFLIFYIYYITKF